MISAVLAVLASACSLAPFLAVYGVATVLFASDGEPDLAAIGTIAWLTAGALLLRMVAGAVANHVGHVTAYRTLADLRRAIATKLQVLPLGRVQARSAGEMKKILHDDVEQMEEALAHGVPDGAAAAAVPIATTAVLLVVDWRLALVALGALLLLVLCSAVAMGLAQRNNAALAAHTSTLNRAVLGYLQGIKVIRGYLGPTTGYDRARAAVIEGVSLSQRATSGPMAWLVSGLTVATGLAVALMLPVAGLRHADGEIGLATLVLFLVLSLGYLTPIVALVGTLATIATRLQMASGTIAELLAEESLPAPERGVVPDHFDVTFEDVDFAYPSGRRVLTGVSLQVPAGSTLALVGESGGGKSTLARLLARFYDVESGAVRIGGIDVREIPADDLARLIAFVQQDEYIFGTTLLENIRIARPDADDEEVVCAAERAQLAEVALGLPNGWHTELPAGGGTLSGGQRQRIAVARAMLKDAPVVVLDEVTASLDALTEQRTLDAIADLTRDRTVVAIAHRLSTIVDADQVAVIGAGQVQATGTHSSLVDHRAYRDLWQAYQDADGWRLVRDETRPQATAPRQPEPAAAAAAADDWSRAATAVVRPGVGEMTFAQQWRTLYGRSWRPLLRRGLMRMTAEGALRGAPLAAVFAIVLTAIGEAPWGPLTGGVVWAVTGLLALTLLLRLAASTWANQLIWSLAARSKADLQLSVLDRLRRVPLGFLNRSDRGRLGTLVGNDIPMIDFQNTPQQVVGSLAQPVYAAALLLIIDWRLALAALAGLPLFWLLMVLSDRTYHRVFARMHQARQEATTMLLEQHHGAAVLRGNPESMLARRYQESIEDLARASTDMSVRATPATALGTFALEAGQVLLIVVGTSLYASGGVGAATLLLFLMLTLALYQPIQELSALTGYRRNQQQIAAKLAEVWDAPVLPEPDQPAVPVDTAVELRDVTFRYDQSADPALRGISFRAEPGTITALVGQSGSGKSTIANVVGRLWDVESGAVLIGGADVQDLGSEEVARLVTTVYQETYLFEETIRFNVTMGRPVSDELVWMALVAARCEEFVRGLPQGLDSVISDGGADLSGGQRQRLAIARALVKDSPVLVLDEAVASVDPATEDHIQQALAHLAAGRTVIVVAHRLATVTAADVIVLVEDGTVRATGTHAELLQTSQSYRDLATAQGLETLLDPVGVARDRVPAAQES